MGDEAPIAMSGELAKAFNEVVNTSTAGPAGSAGSGRPVPTAEPRRSTGGTPASKAIPAPDPFEGSPELNAAYREVMATGGRLVIPVEASSPPARWPWVVLGVVVVCGAVFAMRQRAQVMAAAAPIVTTPEERQREMQLLFLADRIAGYVRRTDSLPPALADVDIFLPHISYERHGRRNFTLTSQAPGSRLALRIQVPASGPLVFAFVRPTP